MGSLKLSTLLLTVSLSLGATETAISPSLDTTLQTARATKEGSNLSVVKDRVAHIREHAASSSCEDTFHVVDVGVLPERLALWKKQLPNVYPHYAFKTNSDPVITAVMAHLGTGFDCASEKEVDEVLALGVSPSQIVYANPRKPNDAILHAKDRGIDLFTFDSQEEMDKILELHPEARLLLRIITEDSHSANKLSVKFGATMDEARAMLDAGFAKNANIVGIAFHVGSNCAYWPSYEQAINDSAALFDYTKTHCNHELTLLDLGGGWPGTDDESFIKISNLATALLHEKFNKRVHFIAEPGRFFASKTTTIATRIIGTKKLPDANKRSYYIANGTYGCFLSSLFYGFDLEGTLSEGWLFKPLRPVAASEAVHPSLLWGPTCDSMDKVIDGVALPDMHLGEFLMVEHIGAYSTGIETGFNGIAESKPYYICEVTE